MCRYKEITTFLAETEKYLGDLSQTIMQRKLREVEEQAFKTALAEAHNNGVPDEAAEKDAMRAAKEAKENCSFMKLSEDHAGDAQVCEKCRPALLARLTPTVHMRIRCTPHSRGWKTHAMFLGTAGSSRAMHVCVSGISVRVLHVLILIESRHGSL